MDPGLCSPGFTFADHWPDVRVAVLRIAHTQAPRDAHKLLGELFSDRALNQDTLHREAYLPSVREALQSTLHRSVGNIGVLVDDYRRVGTKFQGAAAQPNS